MGDVEYLSDHRAAQGDVKLSDVIGALHKLGGEAHRDLVVARVLSEAQRTAPVDRAKIAFGVDEVLSYAEGLEGGGLCLRRVYGPASNRWKLASPPGELTRFDQRRSQG